MDKLAQPLHLLLEKNGLHEQFIKRPYLQIWPHVIGKQAVSYTRPVKIEHNKLIVEVNDSTWLYHLTLLKDKIIADFNTRAGSLVVKDIKFINADFWSSREESGKENLPKNKVGHLGLSFQNSKEVQLKEEETKKIEEIVCFAPDYLQARLRRLYKNYYRQQIYIQKKGAKQCQRCRGMFYNLKEKLCFFCEEDLVAWRAVLDYFFKQTPWGSYADLRPDHPLLDEQLFNIHREKTIDDCRRRLSVAWNKLKSGDQEQKEKLQELVQFYVLLVIAKEPLFIQQEHIFSVLESFPGLYQFLYEGLL
jgi:disulfide oxidoreductase YuzD